MRRSSLVAIALLGSSLAGACEEVGIDEGVGGGEEALFTSSEKVASNKVASNKVASNGLTANRRSLRAFVQYPLTTATYGEGSPAPDDDRYWLRQQLEDPAAREVFGYLVSCALPEGQTVRWRSVLGVLEGENSYQDFPGGIGVCDEGSWRDGPFSQECQEALTSCLLARVNAFGIKVPIRVDGDPAERYVSAVPTVETIAWNLWDQTIESFNPCPTTATGPNRNCGWKIEHVGTCTPGSTVFVGAGSKQNCGIVRAPFVGRVTAGDAMLRVCAGPFGCDSTEMTEIPWLSLRTRPLGANDDKCGVNPGLEVTCPYNGVFSVMSAPYNSSQSVSLSIGVRGEATFPDVDRAIFDNREGAFFGNMFEPDTLRPDFQDVQVAGWANLGTPNQYLQVDDPNLLALQENPDLFSQGALFDRVYACWSEDWGYDEKYTQGRVCAGPNGGNCLAHVIGSCQGSRRPIPAGMSAWNCPTANNLPTPANEHYPACHSPDGRVWYRPITVFLHDPTALDLFEVSPQP